MWALPVAAIFLALGLYLLVTDPQNWAKALGLIGAAILVGFGGYGVRRFYRARDARLQTLADTDPSVQPKRDRILSLRRMYWVLIPFAFFWMWFATRWANDSAIAAWTAIGVPVVMIAALTLYRAYMEANLDAEARRREKDPNAPPPASWLKRNQSGLVVVGIVVVVFAGIILDQAGYLPFSFNTIFWFALLALLVIVLVLAVVRRVMRKDEPPA